ncbi:CAAX prenyl protease 2 [Orchesella cincta]|uniref:CAAX prenyl protease 2 n=1 Tax=Orchesella cincta TaxID=48709 RepID=A0A1D2N3B4_ORCCI|nr:CAAX prenyl protease 2 [Orchesella cincta]
MKQPVSSFECSLSYVPCFLLAILYVSSLYIWRNKDPSNHPETIKRRFLSILCVTTISPFYVSYFINEDLLKEQSLWKILGLRWEGLLPAVVFPLILTAVLFLGPISMEGFSGLWRIYFEPRYWLSYMKEWIWIRNYVVAPITEEFTFRACMLSLIIHCTNPITAVLVCPVFFGAAHLHHMNEQIKLGVKWTIALATSCFQFTYTSIFGAYSAYLFLRTGHLIAPILVHAFCNHMGFPDFGALQMMQPLHRKVSMLCFALGLLLWGLLLEAMTEPFIYKNDLPWSSDI